jgi:hypothetical protein
MAYRSDKDAREFRREALEQELDQIRKELDPLEARAQMLENDLKEMRSSDASAPRSILDAAVIKNPCPKNWDEMKGDERVRFCGGCKKNVYNIIAMTRVEAEELLGDGKVCARIFKRPDGTVMTSDCAPGRWRRRGQQVAAVAAAATLSAATVYGVARALGDDTAPPQPEWQSPPAAGMVGNLMPAPVEMMGEPAMVPSEPVEPAIMGDVAMPEPRMDRVRLPERALMGKVALPASKK